MIYDLHLHTCLSPCADDNMTPSNVVGMMSLAGAEVIAVTDHNSARNLVAAKKAADFYNIKLLPGIEVNTAEEIHLLCYFCGIEEALEMGEEIYNSLADISVDTQIWGEQLIVDENDEIVGSLDKLLTLASSYDIYAVKQMTEALGGIAVPAHIDRDSSSLLSIMGFMPVDLDFRIVELTDITRYSEYVKTGVLPPMLDLLESSDAHSLDQLTRNNIPRLAKDHEILKYIRRIK